jgi:hypothetical protein
MPGGRLPCRSVLPMEVADGTWTISEELGQRLGCGAVTAAVLPLWFLLLLFVVDSNLALAVCGGLFLVAAVAAVAAVRRIRRLPRTVHLAGDRLSTTSRAGTVSRPLAELRSVEIGTSLGVWPVVLCFADGGTVRLPRDLEDFDGLLAALRARRPDLPVIDHNPPEPVDGG